MEILNIQKLADQYADNTELNFSDEIAEAFKSGYLACINDLIEKSKNNRVDLLLDLHRKSEQE